EPLHSLRMTGALSVGRADTGSAPMGCDVYDKRHGEVIEHPVVCGPRGLAARVQDLPYKVPVQRFNSGVVTARTVCRRRGVALWIALRRVLRPGPWGEKRMWIFAPFRMTGIFLGNADMTLATIRPDRTCGRVRRSRR